MSDEKQAPIRVDLRDDLACRACGNEAKDARFLPCHHFCCKGCIAELAHGSDRKGTLACPECKKEHKLKDDEIERLPVARIVANLQQARSKAARKSSAGLQPGGKSEGGGVLTCPDHHLQLKLLCSDCTQLVCAECAVGGHRNHRCDYVKEASVPRFSDLMSKEAESLAVAQRSLESAAANVDRAKREITEQSGAITAKLNGAFDEMVRTLEQRREEVLADLSSIVQQKLLALSEQDKTFREALTRISSLSSFLSRPIQSGDDSASFKGDLVPRIKAELTCHSALTLQPCEGANIEADINTINNLRGLCTSAMSLYFRQESGTSSLERVEMGRPASYKLSALPSSTLQSTIEVTLTSLTEGTDVPVSLVSGDQFYVAEFTPFERGHHDVIVRVNGKPLRGSPFPLYVTVSPTQLRSPVRVIRGLSRPNGIAFNGRGQMVLSEAHPTNQITIRDKYGKRLSTLRGWKPNNPHGVAVDSEDNIYMSEYTNNRIVKFDREGNYMKSVGSKGSEPGKFNLPRSILVFQDHLYVCDGANNRVQVFDKNLQYLDALSDSHMSKSTMSIAASEKEGLLYVSGTGVPGGVQVFRTDHTYVSSLQFVCPSALCFNDEQGVLYVADSHQKCVCVFGPDGQPITKLCKSDGEEGQLEFSYGIAVDPDGFVYVTDYGNSQILVF